MAKASLDINQAKRLVPIYDIQQLAEYGFEPDAFTEGLLNTGFDVLLDRKTGEILAVGTKMNERRDDA